MLDTETYACSFIIKVVKDEDFVALFAFLGLLCLCLFKPVAAVEVSSRSRMRQTVTDDGQVVNDDGQVIADPQVVDDAQVAVDPPVVVDGDQCPANGETFAVDDEIETYGQNVTNPDNDDEEDQLQQRVSDLLEVNDDKWNQANQDQYEQLLADFRALLFMRRTDLLDDDDDIDADDDVLTCTILNNEAAIPDDKQDCATQYRTIEPHLVNFVRSAQSENIVHAVFWILQTLEQMPAISTACTGDDFEIPRRDDDEGDCRDNIKSAANWIIEVSKDNEKLFDDDKLIKDQIPNILGYCLGTTTN